MMKKRNLIFIASFVLVSVLLVAAAPQRSSVIPLRIENNTTDYVTFQLSGHKWYYLSVPPMQTRNFTIERSSDYTQKFYSCGVFRDPNLDLSKKQTIVVPRCGTAEYNADIVTETKIKNAKTDVSKLYKLVKVTFNNTTNHNLVILFTEGEASYVDFIPKGESQTYTIIKDTYVIEQYGCPRFKEFHFHAQSLKNKDLVCPTY